MAKVVLPLLSLTLLTTLFLFSRGEDREWTIPYAQVELETLAREQRLEKPTFATVMDDGAELTIRADRVRPDLSNQDVITSNKVTGSLALPDGSSIDMQASDVILDGHSRIAELSGNVKVNTSTGYEITTNSLAALLDQSQLIGPNDVDAIGPAGTIHAGSMEITRDENSNSYHLVFNEGVKMVYQPK